MPVAPSRRLNRVKQACEPCRRKKSKCPGEQPACSQCRRLNHPCHYKSDGASHRTAQRHTPVRPRQNDGSATWTARPHEPPLAVDSVVQLLQPAWSDILDTTSFYLDQIESQPFPLFYRGTFLSTLHCRDTELIYGLLAVTARFNPDSGNGVDIDAKTRVFSQFAFFLVTKRISDGIIELSTLQTLILIACSDIAAGDLDRFTLCCSLLGSLASATLVPQQPSRAQSQQLEEQVRCYWSIALLQRLYGYTTPLVEIMDEGGVLKPEIPRLPCTIMSPSDLDGNGGGSIYAEKGILMATTCLSEGWSRATSYIRARRTGSRDEPIWSLKSDYARHMSLLMSIGSNIHPVHRFKAVNLSSRSAEEVNANKEYWSPWFLSRLLYHTTICILNHPLLIMLQLQGHRTIPELCLQQTSWLAAYHVNWVSKIFGLLKQKQFRLTDPLVCHCAAIVATIELQLSVTTEFSAREEKREAFTRLVDYIRDMATTWPLMERLASHLTSGFNSILLYPSSSLSDHGSIKVDLSSFWSILEFPNHRS
ncbi:hypothetical protein ASPVEDRAFT_192534 [Aspergillus versicolor CBS 583.65]|uniref:Zn(2)-C6 fungal-type domain-containing protein n=1 Tax=Aspergillus versicolor CBS 583.65 TaxID=1036611 RepID=A0A1L9PKV3_ASPVE|nr:uncharacterized protein ASPVEDRAFT_192534 [Aspergillus versicolor CBS 583.65]OJJ02113.1 hypothetical protein ASPVEDRAFT_192534 [Aspergillus versicolor CBS 583.65]